MSVRPWIPPRKPTPPPQFSMVETKVPPPSEVPEVVPAGKMQKLLPILMVIAIVGMIGIFFATGLRRMSPFMLLFPLMFLASGAGMMGGYGASGGKKTPEINAERRKYTEMLTKLRGTVHQRAAQQYALLAHTAPPPETLASLIGGPANGSTPTRAGPDQLLDRPSRAQRAKTRRRDDDGRHRPQHRSRAGAKRGGATLLPGASGGRRYAGQDRPENPCQRAVLRRRRPGRRH
ncbi:cell division FtsK/SpoIIIE domain protein [Mycobacterium xenopi 4042]|uniref:Cell division FtsK/SpoIIIE domain protein n=1 Tax=Mycobacterium xenopi 4042 TaxID=1299334 RepID=X7YQZ6_MYCXE|nr:cell division FtsK/SpoIIIE domain protein [Mycobacterium xenopi 4042]